MAGRRARFILGKGLRVERTHAIRSCAGLRKRDDEGNHRNTMNHGLIRLITEHSTLILGKLGSWTPKLLTLGRWDVDEGSWTDMVIGWVVLLGAIIAARVSGFSH